MTRVVIGIPTLNGPERLDRCLTSIAECTNLAAFESVRVLVCDDGSTEGNTKLNKDCIHRAEKLRDVTGLEMIVSANRAGIAASWNKLVRHQPADVIVLINDDIEVVPHWLDVLVYSVMKNQQVGMVSLNQYVSLTKGQHREAFAHMLPHEAQPIVDYHESNLMTGQGQLLASHGSIFAFRRDSYDLAGGFDERYFVYYEECDFGVSLCEKGFIHAIASYPIVYHQGGATLSDLNNLDANAQLVRSRCLFHAKWKKSVIEMRARYQAQAKASGVLENLNEWNTALIHLDDQART